MKSLGTWRQDGHRTITSRPDPFKYVSHETANEKQRIAAAAKSLDTARGDHRVLEEACDVRFVAACKVENGL